MHVCADCYACVCVCVCASNMLCAWLACSAYCLHNMLHMSSSPCRNRMQTNFLNMRRTKAESRKTEAKRMQQSTRSAEQTKQYFVLRRFEQKEDHLPKKARCKSKGRATEKTLTAHLNTRQALTRPQCLRKLQVEATSVELKMAA